MYSSSFNGASQSLFVNPNLLVSGVAKLKLKKVPDLRLKTQENLIGANITKETLTITWQTQSPIILFSYLNLSMTNLKNVNYLYTSQYIYVHWIFRTIFWEYFNEYDLQIFKLARETFPFYLYKKNLYIYVYVRNNQTEFLIMLWFNNTNSSIISCDRFRHTYQYPIWNFCICIYRYPSYLKINFYTVGSQYTLMYIK